jgi:hypothetical protein
MAKLIFSLDGAFLGEYPLDKERMTIGRRPANDIHIDNLAVSGEHATIVTIGNDSFLEDLGSTNGTLVNGKQIKKHVLQHGDALEFGKYQLRYINEAAMSAASTIASQEDFEKTMIIRPSAMKPIAPVVDAGNMQSANVQMAASSPLQAPATPLAPAEEAMIGRVQVLNGPSMGKELVLNKALTTLGKPGVQVAVITKRPQGYFITHVEGQAHPVVNGKSAGAQAHSLNDHDVIELAGVKMEFYLAKA